MTGADVAAMITAAGGASAAILGGLALFRRRSSEIARAEREEAEECFERRRAAYRWVRILRDLLSEAGIPEPEGIDDDLGVRRSLAKSGSGDGD